MIKTYLTIFLLLSCVLVVHSLNGNDDNTDWGQIMDVEDLLIPDSTTDSTDRLDDMARMLQDQPPEDGEAVLGGNGEDVEAPPGLQSPSEDQQNTELETSVDELVANPDDPDVCWLTSYGRGIGDPISDCPEDQDKDGALCYPKCEDGYSGVGPVCWQDCPEGFQDTGADCLKPESYGRGAGYALWDEGKCGEENEQGCEKNGLLFYPKCAENFHAAGCCVCSPNCPEGMPDIGVSCQKNSNGRTAGTPLSCPDGAEMNGALCYPACKDKFVGGGPVCWGTCPEGYQACGLMCVKDQSECTGTIAKIGTAALSGIISIGIAIVTGGTAVPALTGIAAAAGIGNEVVIPVCAEP